MAAGVSGVRSSTTRVSKFCSLSFGLGGMSGSCEAKSGCEESLVRRLVFGEVFACSQGGFSGAPGRVMAGLEVADG